MEVLDAKALCFENTEYKGVLVGDLTMLLSWYSAPKEKRMKNAQMVDWWKRISINHVPPPTSANWTADNKQELERLKTTEIDMLKTALGCYAAQACHENRGHILLVILEVEFQDGWGV